MYLVFCILYIVFSILKVIGYPSFVIPTDPDGHRGAQDDENTYTIEIAWDV